MCNKIVDSQLISQSVENIHFQIKLTFRVNIAAGKFHGVIIAATPTGWRINTNSLPLVGAGTT